MIEKTPIRAILAGLFLVSLLGGAWVGVWNHQQIQSCHQEYDDDPETFVECEDAFTTIMYGLSIFGVATGAVGIGWILKFWND